MKRQKSRNAREYNCLERISNTFILVCRVAYQLQYSLKNAGCGIRGVSEKQRSVYPSRRKTRMEGKILGGGGGGGGGGEWSEQVKIMERKRTII